MKIGKIGQWVLNQQNYKIQFKEKILKPMQVAIINCNKKFDAIVNLPTGFGKSMLYQYPASILKDKCIIVFVPLRALLWDAIRQAQLLGITAQQATLQSVQKYESMGYLPQLLFLTPQKLVRNEKVLHFIETLHEEQKIQKFIIDEAHCVSQWGSDFRPDYLELSKLKKSFPGTNILAMSATLPPQARTDLKQKLNFDECYYFQASFNRSNLIYEVKDIGTKAKAVKQIRQFISERQLGQNLGIIYCQTIKCAKQIYQQLKKSEHSCELFHSGVAQKKRSKIYEQFKSSNVKIIVATICFGMGINKEDIRYVIHVGISSSVQNYYQESGRAGRDGKKAYCLLLTFNSDDNALIFLAQRDSANRNHCARKIIKIGQMKQYAKKQECRRVSLFDKLGQQFSALDCKKYCDMCARQYNRDQYQVIDLSQKGLKIITTLMKNSSMQYTAIQLASHLRGKQTKKKIDFQIFGILKDYNIQVIDKLVQFYIENKLLSIIIKKNGKGFMNKYLKPGLKSSLKKIGRITFTMARKKKLIKREKSLPDNIGKYIEKKKLNEKASIIHVDPSLQQIDQQQMQEAKMKNLGNQEQQFLLQLFDEDKLTHKEDSDQQQQSSPQNKKHPQIDLQENQQTQDALFQFKQRSKDILNPNQQENQLKEKQNMQAYKQKKPIKRNNINSKIDFI